MSILTGDPRGRVVFHWPDSRVVVVQRDRVELASIDRYHLNVKRDGDETTREYFLNAETDEHMRPVLHSIVAEDTDVIWTYDRTSANWTRVPHAPGEELGR